MLEFLSLLLMCCVTGTVNCNYAVRWNSALSAQFAVFSGVRQDSYLSPAISNVFINVFIKQLNQLGVGCHISSMFLGCILYADDIAYC